MAYCEYPRDFMAYDITPVENLFLMEHMPHAPGDYVRVYLYGLMLCRYPSEDASAETVAKALGIKPEEVEDAFRYWERQGLVVRLSDRPPRYQYISPQRALLSGEDEQDGAYRYRDFFAALQEIFGADRLLTPQEQGKAVEWVETLGLPEEVVLRMTRAQVEKLRAAKRSLRYVFRDLDKTAETWSREGVNTLEAAEERLAREGAAAQAAEAVCRRMGVRRAPTLDEIRMAATWVEEWGLSQEEILSACAAMTSATNPSFAYVNSVLSSRRSKEPSVFQEVREILADLGATGMPTPAQEEAYEGLLGLGFDHEAIRYAAGQCAARDRHTFEDLQRRLEAWKKEGLTTRAAAEEYARNREPAERLMAQVYELLGKTTRPGKHDIAMAMRFLQELPAEVILFAAERSRESLRPMQYMEKILEEWKKKGVADLEGARAESAQGRPAAPASAQGAAARPAKVNPAREYEQRAYDDEQMRRIAMDLDDLTGGDEHK